MYKLDLLLPTARFAFAVEGARLEPNVPVAVATGLALEIPPGYEAQIRPRSGLALRHAITLPNAPATIDPGYRGVWITRQPAGGGPGWTTDWVMKARFA